ncbi:MAG: knotted carbamoyltransferase YgeW [Spirochaetes bacterium]|nr:knotted carbamoyltransferase YgeW [Spirochaetota bacterium]
MDKIGILESIKDLAKLRTKDLYLNDFLLTWEKSMDELKAHYLVAEILRGMRENNLSTRLFDSGLGISLFRDASTRTRFSYASACNLLGIEEQVLDESKSQISHGETVRETANMISFMADVIGIRDDMYIGRGNTYMREVSKSVLEGYREGVLEQRPTLVNLQCDIDHPTQSMSDALHLINYFGGIENLKGKKIAMTWAYSPSYGKPLSVPQGIVGLLTRFGAELHLAHPKGYEIMPEVEEVARRNAAETGGKFTKSNSMSDAFEGAHVVYPKSWAPFAAMEKRTKLYDKGDDAGIKALEKELLAQNANHKDWECTEEMMAKTHNGEALYMHCLPADITGVSCKEGEVAASVFERYRIPQYKEASYKPYIIAAMIFLSKVANPAEKLQQMVERGNPRMF